MYDHLLSHRLRRAGDYSLGADCRRASWGLGAPPRAEGRGKMYEGGFIAVCVIVIFLSLSVFGLGINTGRKDAMIEVHATLETRCVEGEQYSRDLLACVITRQGR